MVDRDALVGRHVAIQQVMPFFDYGHLTGRLRKVSMEVHDLAYRILESIPEDHPQLIDGLKKLIEAKDCFVRAKLAETQPQEKPVDK